MLGLLTARRFALPLCVFVLSSSVYVATLGERVRGPSDNAHFVHLADSFLHGQLSVVGNRPPGDNDWAHYRGRWFVSFPPLPALIIAPAVALFGTATWDRLFWALFAGLAPALLCVLLRSLRERGLSERSPRDDLAFTALFAFGSAYYYTAVQGTVWFAAHVVASALLSLYLLGAIGAARPLLAGAALAAAFMTRPTMLLLGLAFVLELPGVPREQRLRRFALFCGPLVVTGLFAMWLNAVRFDDTFEFGHSHLDIRWRARIEKWGLFNYHYFGKNLAVFLAAMPWLSSSAPYLRLSRHGLALWVTTPHYLGVLWPKGGSRTTRSLAVAAAAVAVLDLCYQNSGWIQFGYRFSLDYSVVLVLLLALGGRKLGAAFYVLLAYAIAVNTFGAVTFERVPRFYDHDPTQNVIFQPD